MLRHKHKSATVLWNTAESSKETCWTTYTVTYFCSFHSQMGKKSWAVCVNMGRRLRGKHSWGL